jgi:hypothetical protein
LGRSRKPGAGDAGSRARLTALAIEHPDPAWVADLYRRLDIESAPQVRQGSGFRYQATIETPQGVSELW